MGKLTIESGQEIAQKNLRTLYELDADKYPETYRYLNAYGGGLKKTLCSFFNYIMDKKVILYAHSYCATISGAQIVKYIRKKGGKVTAVQHFNMLCALDLLRKVTVAKDTMGVEREGKTEYPYIYTIYEDQEQLVSAKRRQKKTEYYQYTNTYSFRRLSAEHLQKVEERAVMLRGAGVTVSHMTYTGTMPSGLDESFIRQVFPYNNKAAAERKDADCAELMAVMELLIADNGYTTKSAVKDQLTIKNRRIDDIFAEYKKRWSERFYYGRPTKEDKDRWGLTSDAWIIKLKEEKD